MNLMDLIARHLGGWLQPDPQNRNSAAGVVKATPSNVAPLISRLYGESDNRSPQSKAGMQTQSMYEKLAAMMRTGHLPSEDTPVGDFNTTHSFSPRS